MKSFRKNLSERRLSENMFLAKLVSFIMKSFRRNHSEKILQKKPFRNDFLSQLLGHKVVSERFLLKDSF
jgi:hypothetical protein